MDHPEPSTKSEADCSGYIRLPVPAQLLKEHRPLPIGMIVEQMEALLASAQLGPEFEAMRLLTKNKERFRM